jgi:D-alanine transaminase
MGNHIAYVNRAYVARNHAAVSIEDRGYQFADGIYEVIWVKDGVLIDAAPHFKRLHRSLMELKIAAPTTDAALKIIIAELLRRNHASNGDYMLYLQITRGVARRNHIFPKNVSPSLTMTLTAITPPTEADVKKGVKVITQKDIRWARRDIKSISLLPNILARQTAYEAGAREAMLMDGDAITEGSTANIFIIKGDMLITHPADNHILNGVTRMSVLSLAKKLKMKIEERAFTLKQALAADEAFITSTTAGVLPISQIDATKKAVGEWSLKLYAAYQEYVSVQC